MFAELPQVGSTAVVVRYAFSRTSVNLDLADFVSLCCSVWLSGSSAVCWEGLPVVAEVPHFVSAVVPSLCATASFIAVSVLAVVPAFGRRNYRLS